MPVEIVSCSPLAKAIALAKKQKATLVITKLDRLARNVHFISGLMESGIDFEAADMPGANRLTIHILSAVAEHEREMISQRTKAALAAAKARGTELGRNGREWPLAIEHRRSTSLRRSCRSFMKLGHPVYAPCVALLRT